MDKIKEAPMLTKLSFIPMGLGFLLNITGFASPNWMSGSRFHAGLWSICYNAGVLSRCASFYTVTSSVEATRAFAVLGFLGTIATPVLVGLSIILSGSIKNITSILSFLSAFGTAGCLLLSVIIFGSNTRTSYLSWSFGLCIVAALIYGSTAVLLLSGYILSKRSNNTQVLIEEH